MLTGMIVALMIAATPTPNPAAFPPLLKWVESQELMKSNLLGPLPHAASIAQTSVLDCFRASSTPEITSGLVKPTWSVEKSIDKTACRYGAADLEYGEFTGFNAGMAGPERFSIQYDAKHALARISRGCCSWHQDILISGVTPPPEAIVETDLSARSTAYGLHLGGTRSDVERIFGRATSVAHKDNTDAIFYRHLYHDPNGFGAGCGEEDIILLKSDRIVGIAFTNGC
jgi:hypothetical protein